MTNSVYEELKKTTKPEAVVSKGELESYIWVNILIRYNPLTGKAEIVRSFSRPAKDAVIKAYKKPVVEGPKIEKIDVENDGSCERLF
jgi:hypothetical protein